MNDITDLRIFLASLLRPIINEAVKESLQFEKQQPAAPLSETDKILTVAQVADFLTLTVPTVYGLVQKKTVPYMKRGKRLYFSKAELTEWVKSGRKKTASEIDSEAEQHLNRRRNAQS